MIFNKIHERQMIINYRVTIEDTESDSGKHEYINDFIEFFEIHLNVKE